MMTKIVIGNADRYYIRCAAIIGFSESVEKLGGSPEPLLRKFDLPTRESEYGMQIISCTDYANLLEEAATTLNKPNFALECSKHEPAHYPNCGPLALLLLLVRTFGEAAELGMKYWNVHTNAFNVRLCDDPDDPNLVAIRYVCAPGFERTTQLTEGALATICGIARRVTRRYDLWPTVVRFQHSRPPRMSLYRELFNCKIEFDSEFDEIVIQRDILSMETGGSFRMLLPFFEKYIRMQISKLPLCDQSMRETTRAAVDSLLGSNNCNIGFISGSLGMSAKKLQRLLADEGASFIEILSSVRRERACNMLENSSIKISDMAKLLEYAAPGAFTYAFMKWTGLSPSEYRKIHSIKLEANSLQDMDIKI